VLNRYRLSVSSSLERHFPRTAPVPEIRYRDPVHPPAPATQIIALAGGTLALAWTIVATALIMMDSIGAGSAREQSVRQQALYEERLNALSSDRDLRAEEAARAQERFNVALTQVSEMQERLLASEDRRRELETGIDTIQDTLRRTIKERDEARSEAEARDPCAERQSGGATEMGRAQDTLATLEIPDRRAWRCRRGTQRPAGRAPKRAKKPADRRMPRKRWRCATTRSSPSWKRR
jgi:hypothetical protein